MSSLLSIWLQLHIFQILISPRLGRVPERAMAAEAPLISAEREMLEAVASDDAERAAGGLLQPASLKS